MLLLWAILFSDNVFASDSTVLYKQLNKFFPGIQIVSMPSQQPFVLVWKLMIPQYLHHEDTSVGKFMQQVFVYHRGFKKPNVMVTEGYEIKDRVYEPTLMLDANQISIEYRFFGESVPSKMDWSLLNHHQAMEDYKKIQDALRKIYKKCWLVTGISKGGTTAALYSLTYPTSVQATMAYVAPFPVAQEDSRTIEHYKMKVGTPDCRRKIQQFQRTLLMHREALKPKLMELAKSEQVQFTIGLDQVIDYASVEYPFSFWQWGFGCNTIPGERASIDEIFEHIEEVVDFNYYDDKTILQLLPAYYQFLTEYGYYGFDTTGLSDLLVTSHLSNLNFCPKDADLSYHGEYMQSMRHHAEHMSHNIIYIYGGADTWTSCAVDLKPTSNAIKLVLYQGGHRTRLRDFQEHDRNTVYKALRKWMKAKVDPLPY